MMIILSFAIEDPNAYGVLEGAVLQTRQRVPWARSGPFRLFCASCGTVR